jgi:uncharacterized protein
MSLYDSSIPAFVRGLTQLHHQLEKAEASAAARKFDVNVLVQTRLAPDMLPFSRQVQIACDTSKNCAWRLTGIDAPKFEDNETTIAELKARIMKTIDFLKTVPAEKFVGAETRDVTVPLRPEPVTLKGAAYFHKHAIPNFYFHLTAAYALMRHNGVDVGKSDFIGSLT